MQALKLNEIFNEHLAFFFVFVKLPYQIYGRTPKQPVSKRPAMKFKKPNLTKNTPETKTAKIHNTYIQNAQCQKAQFFLYRD
jgi:hypothetical protein